MNVNIAETATIGKNCIFGNNVVIMDSVVIGNNVSIGNNCVIYPQTIIENHVEIQDNAVLGKRPRASTMSKIKIQDDYDPLRIEEDCLVGTSVIIYCGTKIGKKCLIGDLASIRENCLIDDYTIIGSAVTINVNTRIGKYTKIQTGCHITGNMIIEDHVFFGPEATTMNDAYMGRTDGSVDQRIGPTIKSGARIGSNATIMAKITIGRDAVVGAGSVVTKDVADGKVAVGVPAREIKDVPPEHRLKQNDNA